MSMNDPKTVLAYCRWMVFVLGLLLLGMAIFMPDLRFSQRCNFVTSSMIDFGAWAFTYLWPRLHK